MKIKFLALMLTLGIVFSCKKDDSGTDDDNNNNTGELFVEGNGVTDSEGNTYRTIIITTSAKSTAAGQEWMAENLRATKYPDGSDINASLYSAPNNDANTVSDLGYLYTWDALMNNSTAAGSQGACPDGWHIPTVDEYNTLINALGGMSAAGQKLKSTDTEYWEDVTNADNLSGFNALGAGHQNNGMTFFYKTQAKFWTSTEDGANAREVQMDMDTKGVLNNYGSSKTAIKSSCRCLKD